MISNFDLSNDIGNIISESELHAIQKSSKKAVEPKSKYHKKWEKQSKSALRDFEVLIPIISDQKLNLEDRPKLFRLIRTEFATRYLEKLGVDLTTNNINRLYHNLGKDFFEKRCNVTVKKGLKNDMRFISIVPKVKMHKRTFLQSKPDVVLLDDFDEFSKGLRNGQEKMEEKDDLFDLDFDMESTASVYPNVESFEEYYQRYIHPYNVFKNVSNPKATPIEKLQANFTVPIYELLHGHGKKSSFSPIATPSSARSTSFEYYLTTPTKKSKRKDIFSATDGDKIRKRYQNLFKENPKSGNELIALYDKELVRPPFLSKSEIRAIQTKFAATFPFDMWKSKLSSAVIQSVKKYITCLRLSEFIMKYCSFCYWTFLSEFGKQKFREKDLEVQFIDVYADVLQLIQEHNSKQSQIITMPITLLAIRIVTESVFAVCYPQFWNSALGTNLARRMDVLITFLLDPQLYLSQFAPVEGSTQTRSLKKRLDKQLRNTNYGKRENNRGALLSPLIKFVLGNDAQSLGTRKLMKNDPTTLENCDFIIRDLFKSETIKSKLLAIMMKQKLNKRSSTHGQVVF